MVMHIYLFNFLLFAGKLFRSLAGIYMWLHGDHGIWKLKEFTSFAKCSSYLCSSYLSHAYLMHISCLSSQHYTQICPYGLTNTNGMPVRKSCAVLSRCLIIAQSVFFAFFPSHSHTIVPFFWYHKRIIPRHDNSSIVFPLNFPLNAP
jgi:hypothetical protein